MTTVPFWLPFYDCGWSSTHKVHPIIKPPTARLATRLEVVDTPLNSTRQCRKVLPVCRLGLALVTLGSGAFGSQKCHFLTRSLGLFSRFDDGFQFHSPSTTYYIPRSVVTKRLLGKMQ